MCYAAITTPEVNLQQGPTCCRILGWAWTLNQVNDTTMSVNSRKTFRYHSVLNYHKLDLRNFELW